MIKKLSNFIGMRTLKTGLSVFLSVLACLLLKREAPTMAVLGAVFSMRQGTDESLKSGISRTFGNALGALLALFFVIIYSYMPSDAIGQLICLPIGVMFIIIVCAHTKNHTVIVPATATFVTIFILSRHEPNYIYALQRVVDTMIGSTISLLVNRYIYPHSQ